MLDPCVSVSMPPTDLLMFMPCCRCLLFVVCHAGSLSVRVYAAPWRHGPPDVHAMLSLFVVCCLSCWVLECPCLCRAMAPLDLLMFMPCCRCLLFVVCHAGSLSVRVYAAPWRHGPPDVHAMLSLLFAVCVVCHALSLYVRVYAMAMP
ncbi:MAG: hypothetical protein J3R72DRAFT_156511 [Linnemannia gamsii]|nr:MAG: hypothetical protein J3R72DRAFT_156511 [Linnemannia gamsii]